MSVRALCLVCALVGAPGAWAGCILPVPTGDGAQVAKTLESLSANLSVLDGLTRSLDAMRGLAQGLGVQQILAMGPGSFTLLTGLDPAALLGDALSNVRRLPLVGALTGALDLAAIHDPKVVAALLSGKGLFSHLQDVLASSLLDLLGFHFAEVLAQGIDLACSETGDTGAEPCAGAWRRGLDVALDAVAARRPGEIAALGGGLSQLADRFEINPGESLGDARKRLYQGFDQLFASAPVGAVGRQALDAVRPHASAVMAELGRELGVQGRAGGAGLAARARDAARRFASVAPREGGGRTAAPADSPAPAARELFLQPGERLDAHERLVRRSHLAKGRRDYRWRRGHDAHAYALSAPGRTQSLVEDLEALDERFAQCADLLCEMGFVSQGFALLAKAKRDTALLAMARLRLAHARHLDELPLQRLTTPSRFADEAGGVP